MYWVSKQEQCDQLCSGVCGKNWFPDCVIKNQHLCWDIHTNVNKIYFRMRRMTMPSSKLQFVMISQAVGPLKVFQEDIFLVPQVAKSAKFGFVIRDEFLKKLSF